MSLSSRDEDSTESMFEDSRERGESDCGPGLGSTPAMRSKSMTNVLTKQVIRKDQIKIWTNFKGVGGITTLGLNGVKRWITMTVKL